MSAARAETGRTKVNQPRARSAGTHPPGKSTLGVTAAHSTHSWLGRDWTVLLVLPVAVFLAFLPVLWCDFVNFDDPVLITNNALVKQGVTASSVRYALTTGEHGYPIPLTLLSFEADVSLFGLNPLPFHLENLLLHAVNGALVFAFCRNLLGSTWRAALIAGFFALHPLRVESVAWITERKDVLSMLFGLGALLAYLGYSRHRSPGRYVLVVLLFALSLLAKPMLVTLPLVLLLLDYWPLSKRETSGASEKVATATIAGGQRPTGSRKSSLLRLLLEKLPLFAVVGLVSLWSLAQNATANATATPPTNEGPAATSAVPDRLANALISYPRYLWKNFDVRHLSVFYPQPKSWPAWQVALSGLLLASITAAVIARFRRTPWVTVGWFWFVISMLPVIGLVRLGDYSIADRYTYFPQIGLLMSAVGFIPDRLVQWRRARALLAAACIALLGGLAATTFAQCGVWRDSITLFRHALAVTGDDNLMAHANLGEALSSQDDHPGAMAEYQKLLQLDPQYPNSYNNIGTELAAMRMDPAALDWYHKALALNPGYADAWVNLGISLQRLGRYLEAEAAYRRAMTLRGDMVECWVGLASVSRNLGRLPDARADCVEALRRDPTYAPAHNQMGMVLLSSNDPAAAIAEFQEAVRLMPGSADFHNNLGSVLAQVGRLREARDEFQAAVGLDPNDPGARASLDQVNAEMARAGPRNRQ